MKFATLCLAIGLIVSVPAEAGALSGLFKALFKGGDDAAAHAVRPAPQALDEAARAVWPVAPARQADDTREAPLGAAQAGARALGRCSGAEIRDQEEGWRKCGGEKPGSRP